MNTKLIPLAGLCLLMLAGTSCHKNRTSGPTGIKAAADLDFSEWENVAERKITSTVPRGFKSVKYTYSDKYLLGYFEYDVANSNKKNTDSLSVWIDNDDLYSDQGGGSVFSECKCYNIVLRGGIIKPVPSNEEAEAQLAENGYLDGRWEWSPTLTYDWAEKGFGTLRETAIADAAYGLGVVEDGLLRFEFAVDRSKVGLSDRQETTVGLLIDGGDFNNLATTPAPGGHVVYFYDIPEVKPDEPFAYEKVFYYDDSNFANPERGFYNRRGATFNNDNRPTPPTAQSMLEARNRTNATLTQFLVYFRQFDQSETLPDYVLDYMRQSFQNHRDAGVKTVLRCGYGDYPPDAPIENMEKHIARLKPVFQEYGDVIYAVEAGFSGNCGEWAGSTYINTNENKARLVKALLDAVPSDIQILLRTPGYKRQVLSELWGRSYVKRDSVSAETAFDGSALARLGGHNDCYMATGNDAGTFGSTADREQWRQDTKYTVMGGETCTIAGYYNYCNCSLAPDRMTGEHWSYLNIDYSQDVQNVWRDEGCFDDFVRRLGYRYVMRGVTFDGDFKAGSTVNIKLRLSNIGFACLMRERKLEFVLVNDANPSERTVWVSQADPRRWAAGGTYNIEESFKMPGNLSSSGSYTLYLNLPDISPNLHDNPLFSIRMANKRVWNETLGMNAVAHLTPADKPGDGVAVNDFAEPLVLDFEW